MKTIDYRAKIDIDDYAPLEAHEYAKESLRMRILDDQNYQLEVLKDLQSVKTYLKSQIEYQNIQLKKWQKTPFLTRWFTGDNVHQKMDTCHEVLIYLNSSLGYLEHIISSRNFQLLKKRKDSPSKDYDIIK